LWGEFAGFVDDAVRPMFEAWFGESAEKTMDFSAALHARLSVLAEEGLALAEEFALPISVD
jgi:hypothetical protein